MNKVKFKDLNNGDLFIIDCLDWDLDNYASQVLWIKISSHSFDYYFERNRGNSMKVRDFYPIYKQKCFIKVTIDKGE